MIRMLLMLSVIGFFSGSYVFPQFDILKKVKEKAEEKVEEEIDESIDEALEGNQEENENQDEQNSEQTAEEEQNNNESNGGDLKLTSYSKYDFVPGDQILLFEDFSQDAIGDFPALWTTDGSGEVRTTNLYPGNFFYLNTQDKVYNLMKDLELPQNFIFEFDVIPTSIYEEGGGSSSFYLTLYSDDED